ncbi:MAG: hypothetical protein ACRD98_11370, partial [Nitrososphaera sp.]
RYQPLWPIITVMRMSLCRLQGSGKVPGNRILTLSRCKLTLEEGPIIRRELSYNSRPVMR